MWNPRTCGEKSLTCERIDFRLGSPPRRRGKVQLVACILARAGITPAWAGKSHLGVFCREPHRDHPRVGGEKSISCWKRSMPVGSPPRGRGKGCSLFCGTPLARITPAWAGKSIKFFAVLSVNLDHPRVGGEKYTPKIYTYQALGSPPRGRGKDGAVLKEAGRVGITPAWAGKRLKRSHRSGIFISGPIPFHSVLHRPAGSGGSRAGRDGSPAGQPQNTGPA